MAFRLWFFALIILCFVAGHPAAGTAEDGRWDTDPRRIIWDAQDILDRYLYLWRNQRFDEMYELTADSFQEKTSEETFVGILSRATRSGVRLVEYSVGRPEGPKKNAKTKKGTPSRLSIPVIMVFHHDEAGPGSSEKMKVQKKIAVVRKGQEWRVSGSISSPKKTVDRKYVEALIP